MGSGLNQLRYMFRPFYRIFPGVTVFAEYEHESDLGTFKTILRNLHDPTSENTVTLGFTYLF